MTLLHQTWNLGFGWLAVSNYTLKDEFLMMLFLITKFCAVCLLAYFQCLLVIVKSHAPGVKFKFVLLRKLFIGFQLLSLTFDGSIWYAWPDQTWHQYCARFNYLVIADGQTLFDALNIDLQNDIWCLYV